MSRAVVAAALLFSVSSAYARGGGVGALDLAFGVGIMMADYKKQIVTALTRLYDVFSRPTHSSI